MAISFANNTLLSLDRYAKIMGINPAHFNQAAGSTYFPTRGSCDQIIYQYSWQNYDAVSREEIARQIARAEQEIANELGYWPAPVWINGEVHRFPRFYQREKTRGAIANIRWQGISLQAKWAKLLVAGQLATSSIDTGVTVVYSDEDSDGFDETATVTFNTSVTDECELFVVYTGTTYEIKHPKSISLSSGTATMVFDSWQMIDYTLWQPVPTSSGASAIDIEDIGNYVSTVDVIRKYTDFTEKSAQFLWENVHINDGNLFAIATCDNNCSDSDCPVCQLYSQDGCLHIRDVHNGFVVPQVAEYDEDTGQWNISTLAKYREPDMVKLWYRAGNLSDEYLRGNTCDPLDERLAIAIAHLATARLERDMCDCGPIHTLQKNLREDLAMQSEKAYSVVPAHLANPFGTRRGEIEAYRMIKQLSEKTMPGIAI